jgi:hypothetical protein
VQLVWKAPTLPLTPVRRTLGGVLQQASAGAVLLLMLLGAFASSARASVLWAGDAEEPVSREWASSAAAGPACAVNPPVMSTPELGVGPAPAPATGPSAAHPNAYHFRVSEGDDCYGPRSELGQANPENPALGDRKFYPGQDRWIAFEAYLPDDYQLQDGNGYNSGLMQLKQIGAHSYPAINLISGANDLCLYIDSLHDTQESRHCGPGAFDLGHPSKDAWIKFAIHVFFSGVKPGEAPGFAEVYGDLQDGNGYRLLLPRIYARTSKLDEEVAGEPPLPTQARIGLYRNPLIKGTEDLYVDGFTAATDQTSAEEAAFTDSGPRAPAPALAEPPLPSSDVAGSTSASPPRPAAPEAAASTVVWLRASRVGISARRRSATRPAWRLSGGIRSRSRSARRVVTIDAKRHGRWRRVASGRVGASGRFAIEAKLPSGRSALRATVAGVGSSRIVTVAG